MSTTRTTSSALQNEADWLPDDMDQLPAALKHLREQLVAAGRSSAEVLGITGWIVAKALGERDTTAAPTRSRYRRILRELHAPGPDNDGSKRERSDDDDDGQPPIIIVTSS